MNSQGKKKNQLKAYTGVMENSNRSERLNKFLALRLGSSRREADELIVSGRIKVNGLPAILGQRVKEGDEVSVDGKTFTADEKPNYIYLILNKPAGFVCSRRQQGDNPTIYSLLPTQLHNLKPVGRLDKDSSGLLLLTNDGEFAHKMTHPSFKKIKSYEVSLLTPLDPEDMRKINEEGVQLEDGLSKFSVIYLDPEHQSTNTGLPPRRYIVEMTEGRNRQIRRTFAALGHKVSRLHRTQFGQYMIGDLGEGHYQVIDIS